MRRERVGQPSADRAGDLQIVLFQHDHVPVAMDAVLAEAQRGHLYPGLRQVFGRAVVIGRVIGSLGGVVSRRRESAMLYER